MELEAKAQHEQTFQNVRIDLRNQYLDKIDKRDVAQEHNKRDLVKYAKKITAELEDYKQKVELSEKIVEDLQ